MTTHNHDVLMAVNSRIINGRSGGAKQLNADYKALLKARDEILKLREALAEQPAPVAKPHEQEPVAWLVECGGDSALVRHTEKFPGIFAGNEFTKRPLVFCDTSPSAQQQEPVPLIIQMLGHCPKCGAEAHHIHERKHMKTVIEMAREAGFTDGELAFMGDNFIRFAELVRADERKAEQAEHEADKVIIEYHEATIKRLESEIRAEREALIGLLKGIDKTEIESADGWWETSSGAEFGAGILAAIRARGQA